MTSPNDTSDRSPVKRALLEIATLRERVAELERDQSDPVAVIGLSLRLPGANDEESFWKLLLEGRSGISETPADRWDRDFFYSSDMAAPGKTYARHGGFIDRVDEFDAAFFGIPPVEAARMDPQQRLLLEVAWEAMENAAQSPDSIAETSTGVYLGIATSDYQRMLLADPAHIDSHTGTGISASIAAGRLSYLLGLQGPSLIVDTSCSSSLVAIHLACRALRARDCNLALAGGANLILTPENTITLSKARMLAPDGQCKTFDASADGFVRSEGCGVLLLKRLADAIRDGDPIRAVIRGSAVNQDGRSGGLTVPSGPAQQTVIRAALKDAHLEPSEVAYVEAHGTGTSLGDPIEVHALVSALCGERPADRPLVVSSVKTNIGHLEAAAGVAGVIKTILAMEHGWIPAHLNFTRLNPHIHLGDAPLTIPTKGANWPEGMRRVAGVSSFGFSGTNAHLVLEQAPTLETPTEADAPSVLTLSARSETALRETARRYASYLEAHPGLRLGDVCFTAATGRKMWERQAHWKADSVASLVRQLEAFASGEPLSGSQAGNATPPQGRRIALPTYPFERSRFWLDAKPSRDSFAAAIEGAEARAASIPADLDLETYTACWICLRRLTRAAMAGALEKVAPPSPYTAEELAQHAGFLPRYTKLLERWLNHLTTEGVVVRSPDGRYNTGRAGADTTFEQVLAESATTLSIDPALLEYVGLCGRQMEKILTGALNPLETIFPGGDFSFAERLYSGSPMQRAFNSLAAAAVISAVNAIPGRRVRILELGAGTGATTASILPLLASGKADYYFTDVSEHFLAHGRKKFSGYPFVHYQLLDIEREPALQSLGGEPFDVVVATNVLHATADLRRTLKNVRTLLGRGGLLIACEATEYLPWFDITTALIGGWERHKDELRPGHPLLNAAQWTTLLADSGFTKVDSLPRPNSPMEFLGQHVVVGLAPADLKKESSAPPTSAADRLESVQPGSRRGFLEQFVREQLAAVLGHASAEAVSATQRLMDLGMDSLMALDLRGRLESGLHLQGRLSSTLVFDFPNVEAVAAHLEGVLYGAEAPEATLPQAGPKRSEPLAIVGAACRIPGGVNDLDSFWELLTSGKDAISEVPRDRWNIDKWYHPDPETPGKMSSRWGGFLQGVDQFDPQFFGIAPREAESMDPQQRLLLEVSWEALENAGQNPTRLGETRTGVFVGITSDDYSRLLAADSETSNLDAYFASGVARSVAAGRISYVLGLQGPNVSLDTACSSSLVAVHQACQSLREGECRVALAGGVNVILSPETTVALSRARMLAPDGRCKSFDDSADGFVRAEGCVMLVLKRLSDATTDGDSILAVIRGSAVNQDGRSSGLTVPNGPAQEAVIRLALADAGVRPDEVGYVEAHGTGTALGDPIEVHALVAALGTDRTLDRPLRVGSLKANVGHMESAAGAAGLLKTALALSRGEIPPQLHFRNWNSNINLKGSAIDVPVERTPWTSGERRRIAGVSSFGFSGTNAHIVLEEPPSAVSCGASEGAHVLRLSAPSTAALRTLALRYCDFLKSHPGVSLADVVYTARTGRARFPVSLEVRASSISELRTKLEDVAFREAFSSGGVPAAEDGETRGTKIPLPTTPFERQRYWRPSRGLTGGAALLGQRIESPVVSQTVFEAIPEDWPDYLFEHRVGGAAILPMAGFIDIFLEASKQGAIEDVLVQEPIPVASADKVQIVAGPERVEMYRHAGGIWKSHGSARLAAGSARPAPSKLGELSRRMEKRVDIDSHYLRLQRAGVELGPSFQLLKELSAGHREALGRIRVPDDASSYRIHPALLDACFQVLSAAVDESKGLHLPIGLDRFEIFEAPSGELWSHVTLRPHKGDLLIADIHMFGASGEPVASVEGFRLRPLPSHQQEGHFYEVVWREQEIASIGSSERLSGKWLVLGDSSDLTLALSGSLQAAGAECQEASCRELRLVKDEEVTGVVFVQPTSLAADTCDAALALLQALTAPGRSSRPRLLLVTQNAQAVAANDEIAAAGATLWGLARSFRLEYPDFNSVILDVGDGSARQIARQVVAEMGASGKETQVALRGERRYVARIVRKPGDSLQLRTGDGSTLDGLHCDFVSRRNPGPGEIEIRIEAAGLNFRDVLTATGLYPGEPGPLGAECAGYVVRVGDGVRQFSVGDPVVAVAKACLGTFVTTDTLLAARKPASLTMEEAATLSVAHITARYALQHIGRLQCGERVLIHAAAGGVGLAAISEARRMGAVVFATAGTEEKRAYLRSLGVEHVMNSRTLDFGREIMDATRGEGVHAVLNSLSGDFIAENFRVLAREGRYLEIGKNGIWDPERVARERPDVEYSVIDWGEQVAKNPETVARIFHGIVSDAASGVIDPLPFKKFALMHAQDAFREMARGRHTGKIVICPVPVRASGSYLITGGLGGLGLTIADWLVRQGARSLILVGRTAPAIEAERAILDMQARGARIQVRLADAGQREDMARVLEEIRAGQEPLRGVVHAAGVLDNGVLAQQDPNRFARVLQPKVAGTNHLVELTGGLELDFFVLFSSLASVLGSPGQANHSAANSYMDAVAHQLRSQGIPATSINWGPWSGAGAAANRKASTHLAGRGIGFLTQREGLDTFALSLASGRPQFAVAAMDWPEARKAFHLEDPYFSELFQAKRAAATNAAPTLDASHFSHSELMEQLRRRANAVLGLPAEHALDFDRPLSDYGLDSLMAIELRNSLVAAFGKPLPSTLVFSHPTLSAIGQLISGAPAESMEAQPEGDVDDMLARIEQMSDSEADRLLQEAAERTS